MNDVQPRIDAPESAFATPVGGVFQSVDGAFARRNLRAGADAYTDAVGAFPDRLRPSRAGLPSGGHVRQVHCPLAQPAPRVGPEPELVFVVRAHR